MSNRYVIKVENRFYITDESARDTFHFNHSKYDYAFEIIKLEDGPLR